MTTQQIADRLVYLCRQEKHPQAQEELYHQNIISFEDDKLGIPPTKGIKAIHQKVKEWDNNVIEIHHAFVSEPIVTGNYFAITMENDITFKDRGRIEIKEICLYEVKMGKIVSERFFYDL